jgi:outer membrane protein
LDLRLLFIFFIFLSSLAQAQTHATANSKPPAHSDVVGNSQPIFEIGAFASHLTMPDYPGADEGKNRFLVLPYMIYRGDIFRSDREGGTRARFFRNEYLEFDLSLNASLRSSSADNDTRKGMEHMDFLGELGPRLKYTILQTSKTKIDFAIPVRYVFSTDIKYWNARGFTATPELSLQQRTFFDRHGFFRVSVAGTWATEKLMEYFYEVSPEYVTEERPYYRARGGYLGTSASLSYIHPYPEKNMAFIIGGNRQFLADAENRSSPLVKDIETSSFFIGMLWSLYQSKEMGVR